MREGSNPPSYTFCNYLTVEQKFKNDKSTSQSRFVFPQNMYGVLSAIEGYDAFKDLLQNTNIGPWYQRMKTKVKNKEGIEEVQRLKALVNSNK